MKRQLIAAVLGSLIALPAFANNEIDAGNLPQPMASSKSTNQVHAELVQAQRTGNVVVNAELGTVAAPAQRGGKTRAAVLEELMQAYRAGECPVHIVNAEIGTTAKQS